MALKGNQIDLILGLKLSEFFNANKRAWVEFSKTKTNIEKNPIRFKEKGSKQLLVTMGKLGAAYFAITRMIPEMIRLSDTQEKAENRMATALKNAGDATQETLEKQMEFASWIQDVTTVGDEQSLMLQSMALNMQAPIDKIEEVTKNAIALSKAFELDMNVAMRASVSALGDNYTMLTRYIPALRTAGSEAEKAAIYQRSVADGWKTATEELKTNAGGMEDFQNTLGDLKEDLGDFLKVVLIPLIKILEPTVGAFTSLDKSTQQASVAIAALLLIGTRVPAMFTAISASIRTLNASLGPVGWLILGISAAATAWGIYSANAEKAANANDKFNKSALTGLKSHLKLLDESLRDVATKSIDKLIRIRERLYLRMQWALEKNNEELYNAYKSHYENIGELIERSEQDLRRRRDKGKGEIKPLVELFTPEDVQRMELAQREAIEKTEEFYFELADIRTGFEGLGLEGATDEYARRIQFLDDYMDIVREKTGEESELYQQLALKKWAIDLNFNKQKRKLEEIGARHFVALGSEMMATFQGQSSVLFGVGKALAMANLAITKGEAIARAIKDYPWPFNLGVAAIQAALVAGQIANVAKVKFKPAGKAAGGLISPADIFGQSFLPPGEDGWIAAQIGETVMNRAATRKYYPVLNRMNEEGRRGYAEGGTVTGGDVGGVAGLENVALMGAVVEDAIIQGFSKSSLKINGEFTQRGRDMQAVLDKVSELQEQL